VFTEFGLRQRGSCCWSGCRHCPWEADQADTGDGAPTVAPPHWLTPVRPAAEPVDALFWSGGKDSFLAYRALLREGACSVVLLTTFDAASRTIAHQELRVELVIRQAEHLGVPLLGVPLHPGLAYEARVAEAVALIPAVARFVFGDLHLEHIREWRTGAFRELAERRGASLHFPIWQVPCEVLMTDLEASGIVCEVSAVTDAAQGALAPGQRFDREAMTQLPDGVDPFGENGEFHTLAKVWEVVDLP
jgi:ATP-binding cassette subfamily B (MDR/TAP) protein 1